MKPSTNKNILGMKHVAHAHTHIYASIGSEKALIQITYINEIQNVEQSEQENGFNSIGFLTTPFVIHPETMLDISSQKCATSSPKLTMTAIRKMFMYIISVRF